MFRILMLRELLDNLQSARFVIIFLMCSVLVLLSLVIGTHDFNLAQKQYEDSVAQMHETTRQQVSYQALGIWGLYKVYRPPSSLMAFAKGVDESVGTNATVSIVQEPKLQDSLLSVEPVYAQFSAFDFNFVVRVVVALFAMMLTFDVINSEKEVGTLKLLLSHPVPRAQLILAKLAGSMATLLLPLLLPMLIGILAIVMTGNFHWRNDDWLRLALIVGSSILYLAIFSALGVMVSCLVSKPSNALLVSVLFWLVFIWVVPSLSLYGATLATDLPSAHTIEGQKWEIDRQRYKDSIAVQQRWLQEHPGTADVPMDVQSKLVGELQNEVKKKKARIDETYAAQVQHRNQMITWMSRLSPSAAFENIVLVLTATDLARQERFIGEVKQYRNVFQGFVGEKMMAERRDQLEGKDQAVPSSLDLDGLPEFRAPIASLMDDMGRLAPDITVLLLYLLAFCLTGYRVFLNYEVS